MRWKIELFHKILKSGCRAEDAKLRTADRLANLVALFCIVSWRVLWTTMVARAHPEADPTTALTTTENRHPRPGSSATQATAARDLAPSSSTSQSSLVSEDISPELLIPPPGNTVVWRGLRRLADIRIGAALNHDLTYG